MTSKSLLQHIPGDTRHCPACREMIANTLQEAGIKLDAESQALLHGFQETVNRTLRIIDAIEATYGTGPVDINGERTDR